MKILFTSIATLLASTFLPINDSNTTPKNNLNYISDNYYVGVYKADSLFIKGDYEKSYTILDDLFKEFTPVNMEIYNEYKTYVKASYIAGNASETFQHFKNLITTYGISWKQITHDNVLNTIAKENDFVLEDYNQLKNTFDSHVDNALVTEIKSLKEKLNFYRNLEKLNDASMKIKIVNFKKEYLQRIESILNKNGYPSISETGKSSKNAYIDLQDDFYMLLQNISDEGLKNNILPTLKTLVAKGECDPKIYAKLYDYHLSKESHQQKFGTITFDSEDHIQNKDSINIYRKSIGLPSYGYESWRFKNLHPVDYKKINP
ncbi:hypothetical protein SAMN05216480_10198 [Pustulibacterium marinum]|uniref:Uncharacterized protein n=1 Tax=Pustulibacterium marinum TaxID=1224947 RepID=A0A1I7ETG8_9FLAO|nr:hypothetical protein [Pustulibacterium marinum]SFU27189.1 hypothetical protein SAMN05216480_10198 [Pustulibacterium marinum]